MDGADARLRPRRAQGLPGGGPRSALRWPIVLDKWQVQMILALRPSPLTEMLLAQGGWQLGNSPP